MEDIKNIDWEKFLSEADVVSMPTHRLKPNKHNPRTIKTPEFRKLIKDIVRDSDFMMQRPILVNKVGKDHIIYAGHQRWKACIELGWEEVPVSVDTDLDEKVMRERMLLDNIHYGSWDETKMMEFDETDLDHLNIQEMEKDLDMGDEEFRSDLDKPLKNRKNDATEEQESEEHGKHAFSLIFNTDEEREEFQELAQNWAGSERFEDKLIKTVSPLYEDK